MFRGNSSFLGSSRKSLGSFKTGFTGQSPGLVNYKILQPSAKGKYMVTFQFCSESQACTLQHVSISRRDLTFVYIY